MKPAKWLASIVVMGAGLGLVLLPHQAASLGGAAQASASDVPAFHAQPPRDALPATMSASQFTEPIPQNAYTIAGRIKKVLYQQPCYCHCDQSQGHASLLDCFVSKHGSGCNICMGEDFYSYEQTRKGKTPAQIRDGIIKGDWQSVDTGKYATPMAGAK